MTNSFYNVSGAPVTGSSGSSAVIRSEYALIAAAFDKMPALTASTIVGVNSGGTALTNYTTTGTGTTVVLSVSPTTTGTLTHAGAAAIFGTGSAGSGVFGASLAQVLTIGTHSTQAEIILDPNNNRGSFGSGDIRFTAISTTASAANAFLDNASGNSLLRSTSSLAYKMDIQPVSAEDAAAILDTLQPFTYRSKASADDPSRRFYGLGAEEVADVAPALINFTTIKALAPSDPRAAKFLRDAGLSAGAAVSSVGDLLSKDDASPAAEELVPDGVQYERICVLLLAERAQLKSDIAALKAKVGI